MIRRLVAATIATLILTVVAVAQRLDIRVVGVPVATNVIHSSDFAYRGFFRLLNDTHQFSGSPGYLTSRVYTDGHGVNTFRLLITGGNVSPGNNGLTTVYEVPPADVGTSKTDGLPGANISRPYRVWTDVLQRTAAQTVWDGRPGGGGATPVVSGIGYVGNIYGNGNQLVVAYTASYNVGPGDPSLLSAILNNDETVTVYGPWWATFEAEGSNGSAFVIPDDAWLATTGSGRIGQHNPVRGNQSVTTRGANMATFDMPALSTPVDTPQVGAPSTPTIAQRKALWYDANHAQARNTNYVLELGDPKNGAAGCAASPLSQPGAPLFDNDPTTVGFDWTNAEVWIKTSNKEGLIFVSQMTEDVPGMDYSGAPGNRFTGPGHAGQQYNTGYSAQTVLNISASAHTLTRIEGGNWITEGFHVGEAVNINNIGVKTPTVITSTVMTVSESLPGDETGVFHTVAPEPAQDCFGTIWIPVDQSTGPQSTSLVRRFHFFDPQGTIPIMAGSAMPYSLTEDSEVLASDFATDFGIGLDYFTNGLPTNVVRNIRDIGGMVFDPATNNLYVSQANAYLDHQASGGNDPVPVIHVFTLTSPAPVPVPLESVGHISVTSRLLPPWRYKVTWNDQRATPIWMLALPLLGLALLTRKPIG